MGSLELLSTAIEVAYGPVPPPDGMNPETFRSFMRPPLSTTTDSGSLEVVSHRDRTMISLSPHLTEIRDFSGDIAEASPQLPRLLEPVLELLSVSEIQLYNIKFSLEYEARGVGDIGQWLTSKVLNDNFANTFSTDLACGLTDVGFTRGRKFQTLQLVIVQPSTVRVYSVATERAAQLPNREGFERELVAQHDDLLDTLRKAGFD